MRNITLVGLFLLALFLTNGASAETFSASFVETCIGCLDDAAPKADPIINSINLPAGRINLTIDTYVSPYYGMGSVTCIGGFLYSDLGADLVAWPDSYTGFLPGKILESTASTCEEKGTFRAHYVTFLKLKNPVKFKVVIPPSIEYHGSGPQWQYGQTKGITISYEELSPCSITGTYTWFNGRTIYVRSDNTIESWFENTREWYGTWEKSVGKESTYAFNWRNDAADSGVDTVDIADDCQSVYGLSSVGFSVSGTKSSDTTPIKSSVTPKVTETTTDTSKPISDNWNKASVENNPSCKPSFTIYASHMITYIDTYHWNYGKGASVGGTISLKKDDGTIYGPWKVETQPGQGGVPNAWWIVRPNEVIPIGKYTVEDSDVATWSQNQGSNGCGFSKIEGKIYKEPTELPTATYTSIMTPVPDTQTPVSTPYDKKPGWTHTPTNTPIGIPCANYWGPIEPVHIAGAGPRQDPGTYAFFYTEIPRSSGDPRNWVWRLYGNVILKGGNKYFIIFGGSDIPQWFEETNLPIDETFVTTTKDSAIIWYKNDDTDDIRYAYCFKPIGMHTATKSPNIGIVAIVSIISLVYVLTRKR